MDERSLLDAVSAVSPSEVRDDPLGALRSRLVTGWIVPTVGDVNVEYGSPGPAISEDSQITLTVLDLLPATVAVASRRPGPLQLLARILVTAKGPAADRMLVALAFTAIERGDPELERHELSGDLWTGLGVSRRLGLGIRALLERSRLPPRVPRVREVVAQWTGSRILTGKVVGPGDLPMVGARIEVEGTGIGTFANDRGEFRLSPVPSGPTPPTITVIAKGTKLVVRADSPEEPLLIRVPLPES